jgi:hypothetical protein
MKITVRQGIIYGFLAFYILFAFAGIGISGLLFSLAIGLIVLSFDFSLELTVAAVIISGLLAKAWNERKREGFTGLSGSREGFVGSVVKEITKRIETVKQPSPEPQATLSSSYAEGFEDANTSTSATPTPSTPPAPTTAATAPAPTTAPAATPNLEKDIPKPKTSGFTDQTTSGMFKLGEIPSDVAGGAHIDVGTTMMNALNALKPDQVKQMTDDTRKLLETQKSLMGMLSSMKPMLQDGKALMGTFNDMFGKGGPQASAA